MADSNLKMSDWRAPNFELDEYRSKKWVDESIENGDKWLKGQKAIAHLNDDVRLLMGDDKRDGLQSNTLQVDIRSFVETISDLRQIATFGSKAEQFKKSVETYNGVMKYLFWDSAFCHQSRKALQYAMLGRGYLWPRTIADHYGWGRKRIVFDPLGPLEVIPDQLPASNDVQGSYAVHIIRPMPIAEAHARFQRFAEQLKPISRYDWKSYGTLAMARRMDFYDRWRFGEEGSDWDNRYCEIRYSFVRDMRINETGQRINFHKEASWGYEVPFIGELLVKTNPFNQLPESRTAEEADCRMYPQLRLMISSPSVPVPLRDGPAFSWHGEIPVVQYDVNDWPWAPLSYSLVRNVAGLEEGRRGLLSKIDQVTNVTLDPPLAYNLQAGVAREKLKHIDLLNASGERIGVNGKPSEQFHSLLPDSIGVTDKHFKQLEILDASILKSLGLTDISSLKELKMNIAGDQFEKVLSNLGPISKGIAGNMAIAHAKIAYMLKFEIPQYLDVATIMSYVGPDGISMQTFDYDPNSLVPSHMPGEPTDKESETAKRERAKWFAGQLAVVSVPTQLLNVTQQQERLLYMLFLQRNVPLPMATIMEKLGVQNYGTPQGDTLYEQYKNEEIDKLMFKLRAQLLIAMELKKAGLATPEEKGPGQGKTGGRPGTAKKQPKAELKGGKGGAPRAVISQS
jgi:hypothetical protein